VEIRVRAKRFLRYMVRRMAGALIYLGMGKLSLEDIKEFLKGKKCPYTALKGYGRFLEQPLQTH
jgi:tRNA pseudouridine38-40 synthase